MEPSIVTVSCIINWNCKLLRYYHLLFPKSDCIILVSLRICMYGFAEPFVLPRQATSEISTMTRELTRGRRARPRRISRGLLYDSMFRLFKSGDIFIHANATTTARCYVNANYGYQAELLFRRTVRWLDSRRALSVLSRSHNRKAPATPGNAWPRF